MHCTAPTSGVHTDMSPSVQVMVWDYSRRSAALIVDSGHSANIFCTQFMAESGDNKVVSGAGDGEVTPKPLSCHSLELRATGCLETWCSVASSWPALLRREAHTSCPPPSGSSPHVESKSGCRFRHDFWVAPSEPRGCNSCPPLPHASCEEGGAGGRQP